MHIESNGYRINSNLGEDYLEISLQVKTLLDKKDLPYIKLFIHEALENSKAYCKSNHAHKILSIHHMIRRAYSFFMPLFLFSSYKFYKQSIKNQLKMSQLYNQRMKIRGKGLLKTTILFIPILFLFSAVYEYSNRLPLVFLRQSLIKSNELNAFENYLHFKKRLTALQIKNSNNNIRNINTKLKH